METTKEKPNISSNDLFSLKSVIDNAIRVIDQVETPIMSNIKHFIHGLCSHNPEKRSGYAIILSCILERFKDRFDQEETVNEILNFKFSNKKQTQKASIRTALIAKILLYTMFIRSGIVHDDEFVLSFLEGIAEVGVSHPNFHPFVCSALAELQAITNYKYLNETAQLIPSKLDSFIFWFKVSKYCPDEIRSSLPPSFQESPFNEKTAENLQKTTFVTKQPWNSLVWKEVLTDATQDELLVFWPQVFGKQIRTGDKTVKMSIVHIVKTVLNILKPELFEIVISADFIKMINSLLTNPMLEVPLNDFFNYILSLSTSTERNNLFVQYFAYIDYRYADFFSFHTKLFNKCDPQTLRTYFTQIVNFSDLDLLEYKRRMPSDKVNDKQISAFKFDVLRSIFISSGLYNDIQLTLDLYNYITETWREHLYLFGFNLVDYDMHRIEGSASYQMLLQNPEISHFDACFQLCNLCTGISSSPSLNTLIPPDVDDAKPSTDFILIAAQKVNEPPLIKYAFQMHLKEVVPKIPIEELEKFFKEYVPLPETFNQATIEVFDIVLNSCNFTFNFLSSFFTMFCKTFDINIQLAQSLSELIKRITKKQTLPFDFAGVIKSLFSSFLGISNKTINRNERLIFRTFEKILTATIKKSLPLSVKDSKVLQSQLDLAVTDFAFKTHPHFGEEIFITYTKLPVEANQILLPVLMGHIPEVKRLQRRIMLLNIVTTILTTPKGLEILSTKNNDFNKCVLTLLNEDYITSKENEKKFKKTFIAIHKWLQLIEKKRKICAQINIGDIKRKVLSIQKMSKGPIQTTTIQFAKTLNRIEKLVHPKQRTFA